MQKTEDTGAVDHEKRDVKFTNCNEGKSEGMSYTHTCKGRGKAIRKSKMEKEVLFHIICSQILKLTKSLEPRIEKDSQRDCQTDIGVPRIFGGNN